MKKIMFIPFVLLATTALVGCDRGAETAAPPSERVQAEKTVEPSAKTSENGMLTVDPAVVDTCSRPDNVVAARVSWNASAAGTEGIEIWLQSPGEERKLWLASGAVASEQTGPWLKDGSTVTLVNGEDKRELATVLIEGRGCSN